MKIDREAMIKNIVDRRLDDISDTCGFEEACAFLIRYGTTALDKLSDEELIEEWEMLVNDYENPVPQIKESK